MNPIKRTDEARVLEQQGSGSIFHPTGPQHRHLRIELLSLQPPTATPSLTSMQIPQRAGGFFFLFFFLRRIEAIFSLLPIQLPSLAGVEFVLTFRANSTFSK